MAYVTPIGSDPAQVDYRLMGGHGCEPVASVEQLEYHTDGAERPLRWIGGGLAEVGIEAGAVFGEGDVERARALIQGCDPRTGERLVEAKLGVFDDAKVPAAPLVSAVHAVAPARGVEVDALLGSKVAAQEFARLERAVMRSPRGALVRSDQAGVIADVAGLDADVVWGEGVLAGAMENLWTTEKRANEEGVVEDVRVPRRAVVGNLGYDVTLTLPKSYSVLMAFADADRAKQIESVYEDSVKTTFDWLEATTAYGMRGKHGQGHQARTVAGSGFLGWVMTHRAARPVGSAPHGDPHWHVHVTVANMTRGEDGKWSTVAAGGRDLMRHAPAADKVMQALTRHRLREEFGVEFTRNERTRLWEVSAVPEATLIEFSKRGTSIEAMLAELGLDSETATSKQARLAKDRTRQAKDGTSWSDEDLRASWQAEAAEHGVDPAAVAAAALHDTTSPSTGLAAQDAPATTAEPTAEASREELVEHLVRVVTDPEKGLTSTRRRFTTADAIAAVADALPGGAESVEEIESLTRDVLRGAGIVDLREQVTLARDARGNLGHGHLRNAEKYTTGDVVAAEKIIIGAARQARPGDGRAAVTPDVADMAITTAETAQGFPLSREQADIVRALVTSDQGFEYVVGPPGTGKTTLLRAARTAWEADGVRVAGAATAAVAAQNLAAESGIASRTVAQWTKDLQAGLDPFAGVDVLVVDEANLTDDRDRARLYKAAQDADVKVVEVGDPKQLRGVGCGSVFGWITENVSGHALTHNRRQADEDERVALTHFREGRYTDALSVWADKGHLVITDTGDAATTAMVAEWMRQREGAPSPADELAGLLMLAPTNDGVDRLNDAAHAVRAARGEVTAARTYATTSGRSVAIGAGDYVMVRRNDRGEHDHTGDDVLNGTRAVVTSVRDDGALAITWRDEHAPTTDPAKTAVLPASWVAQGKVELGYAMTTHKAEGLTVGRSWTRPDGTQHTGTVLVAAAGADAAGLYVATSRHKGEVRLYAGLEQLEDPQTTYQRGPARTDEARQTRAIDALSASLTATSVNLNDHPVTEPFPQRPRPGDPDPLDTILEDEPRHEPRIDPYGQPTPTPDQDPYADAPPMDEPAYTDDPDLDTHPVSTSNDVENLVEDHTEAHEEPSADTEGESLSEQIEQLRRQIAQGRAQAATEPQATEPSARAAGDPYADVPPMDEPALTDDPDLDTHPTPRRADVQTPVTADADGAAEGEGESLSEQIERLRRRVAEGPSQATSQAVEEAREQADRVARLRRQMQDQAAAEDEQPRHDPRHDSPRVGPSGPHL